MNQAILVWDNIADIPLAAHPESSGGISGSREVNGRRSGHLTLNGCQTRSNIGKTSQTTA
jgi:hypothetical protein